jgi:hypothetical protein
VKVEYLLGRAVAAVEPRGGVGFRLKFEDGTELIYEDSDMEVPDYLEGAIFSTAQLSKDTTELHFVKKEEDDSTTEEVLKLNPMQVGVIDLTGAVSWPARTPVEPDPLPDDPSPERVAEGPAEGSEEE